MWTLDDLRSLKDLWDHESTQDIADRIGVTKMSVQSMASLMRKHGIPLRRKTIKGYVVTLINQLKNENYDSVKKGVFVRR